MLYIFPFHIYILQYYKFKVEYVICGNNSAGRHHVVETLHVSVVVAMVGTA